MAIYHFSGTIISRSQGRSAVACAAYRAGEKLYDARYQKEQDYSKRQDVVHHNILTPNNAPEWSTNREQLWNTVESIELRKDAQLAREFNFALPRELSLEENIKLTEEFIQKAFVDRGMVADLAVHVDHKSDGEYYHAHVMLTTRTVNQDGFGQKARTWNSKDLLYEWRQEWAEHCNRYLALNGLDLRIDHRTLVEQAIPLEPQHKIGPEVAQDQLTRALDHKRIARENGERLIKDPQIALKALTQQQSTFTHRDLARFVNTHSIDAEQFTQVFELIKSQPNIVKLGLDQNQQERFSTKEMLMLESKMLEQASNLFANYEHGLSKEFEVNHSLTIEQQAGFEHLTKAGDLKCLVGYAGTGKSYLLRTAREAWEQQGYIVQGVTLSGIAAESLEAGSGIDSRTFASRSYYWDRGEQLLTNKDIIVVDEAGMLGSRQLSRIVDEVTKANSKLVLVGDPQQLQAIEAGAAFRAISEKIGFVELTEVRRQKENWQREATKEFATGKVASALSRYAHAHHIHSMATKELAKAEMINMWNDVRLQLPENSQIMLAYTRDDVFDLNQKARELRRKQGELGAEQGFSTFRGERKFAIYDRVYFLKNDRNLGVMNGSLGTITNINLKALTIELENSKREVVVDFDLYNHIDHGYAATIHKSQGVTVDRTYLLASKYLDAHAAYVGMTRHRDSVDLFYSLEEFPRYSDLINNLSKNRAKDVSVDYSEAQFAVNYGVIIKEEPIKQKTILVPKEESFPFKNKFSNLEEFKNSDQEFQKLRAEVNKLFASQVLEKLILDHNKEELEKQQAKLIKQKSPKIEKPKDPEKEFQNLRAEVNKLFASQVLEKLTLDHNKEKLEKQQAKLIKQESSKIEKPQDPETEFQNLRLEINKIFTEQVIEKIDQSIEQQLNQHKVVVSQQYSLAKPQELIRGTVGRSVELDNGKQMIEIIQGKDLPIKLVPENNLINHKRGKEVELKFDGRCNISEFKVLQTTKESFTKQPQGKQGDNLKINREKGIESSSEDRDRGGFER